MTDINADLVGENRALREEVARLKARLAEASEREAATSEILQVISRSPTDLQPVFDTIAQNAVKLCGAAFGGLNLVQSGSLTLTAQCGLQADEVAILQREVFPIPIARGSATARAILDRAVVHIRDIRDDPSIRTPQVKTMQGFRTILCVPMLREGTAIGALVLWRREVQPFSDTEIGLMQTFADQAVIAIENVRLFKELETRNRDLTDALARQTATSDILRVISSSPTDVQPVFDSIVESAARLCDGAFSSLHTFDGELMHLVAAHNWPPAAFELARRTWPAAPQSRERGGVVHRAFLERTIVHVPNVEDIVNQDLRLQELSRAIGLRSALAVPMLRDGVPLGVIGVSRAEPGPFSDNQIALLKTFADQAVIAIENVRLFKELETRNRDLTEALDRQTATAEILRVISQSQTEVQPVFDAIVDNAMRLFRAWSASVYRSDGQLIHLIASRGGLPGSEQYWREKFPLPIHERPIAARCLADRTVVHVSDIESDPIADRELGRSRGYRSFLAAPMLRDGQPIGIITVSRAEAGPFSPAEIGLLQTFADQAVIAVENARLLAELRERTGELTRSVDKLTALGEVGRAVSSTLDLETVLTTIVGRAVELSGTSGGVIYEHDETTGEFRLRANHQLEVELVELLRGAPFRLGEGVTGRAAALRTPLQVKDILTEREFALARISPIAERLGYRSILAVPLLLEDRIMGGLTVWRKQPGDFASEIVALLQTFAAQSSLALQNARLFREIAEKSRQVEVASQHKSEFLANMSHELRTPLNAIIGFSEVLSDRMFGDLNEKQEEYLKDIYASGTHLLSLINDILDLSKIEAGRMELELTEFDLPTAIENALMLVRERAGRRSIALHTNIDDRLGQIQGDERKIRQVVLNLLSNAIKFTPEGGRIEVAAVRRDGLVELSVRDTGVGIAPEDQEAVFEEFKQVGTADKKVEGTGLGLALSRKFVELHGGKIWVKSQVGTGSTFTFTIPVRSGE